MMMKMIGLLPTVFLLGQTLTFADEGCEKNEARVESKIWNRAQTYYRAIDSDVRLDEHRRLHIIPQIPGWPEDGHLAKMRFYLTRGNQTYRLPPLEVRGSGASKELSVQLPDDVEGGDYFLHTDYDWTDAQFRIHVKDR